MKARAVTAVTLFYIVIFCGLPAGCVDLSGSAGPHSAPSPMVVATVGPAATPSIVPDTAATVTLVPSPVPAAEATVRARAVSASPDTYSRTYSWTYKNVDWQFTAQISGPIYDLYKGKPHGASLGYADYALTGEDKAFLGDIANKLKDNGKANGYTGYDGAMNVMEFVRALPYAEDATEYTRYPIETLVDDAGDCKDKGILAAALLHEMGYGVVLLGYPKHMAVGVRLDEDIPGTYFVYGGARYYYAETTSANRGIGAVPDDLRGVTPDIYPLDT